MSNDDAKTGATNFRELLDSLDDLGEGGDVLCLNAAEAIRGLLLARQSPISKEEARRVWHRRLGYDGYSQCPTQKECLAFDAGFDAACVMRSETPPRTSMLTARAAYARDLGKANLPWPGDAAMEAFSHGWDDGFDAGVASQIAAPQAQAIPGGMKAPEGVNRLQGGPAVAAPIVTESVTLTERETVTIKNLIELAGALYYALDDSEELPDGTGIQVPQDHSDLLALGLACLDELPDDKPGFVMTSVAKAAWALRRLGNWSQP